MSGKGSSPRPFSVSNEEYANRWDAIFGKDKKEQGPCKHEVWTYNEGLYRCMNCPETSETGPYMAK